MKALDSLKTLSHHSYCLVGFSSEDLLNFLEKEHKFLTKGNPDFFYEKYETLSIDESRRIKEIHSSKSFIKDSKRIFIIECHGMTHEAQNSLLKILEEPNDDVYFFIIIPSVSVLLPTLRSRLHIIESRDTDLDLADAKRFLKLSMKDKITFVDDLAKKISDEELQKNDAVKFLNSLEQVLTEDGVEKNKKALKAIIKVQDYMNDRSPSVKQLLEFVAMSF